MITNRDDSGLTVTGNMRGEKIALSIDQAAMAHIMSVLTDLYSDPELAVIREYSTNALDSHVEAGITDPIEVFLPTPLAPMLRIKDHGIGLSVEDIHSIYSKYGASTKRETNDQVGMLGLGCKSALTYAQQFTLVGIKDGVRCQVAVSRDEDGGGSLTVVDTAATDEPNGVEVVVPAKRGGEIERKARDFFRFWKPGSVLVNGQQPEQIKGLTLTDDLQVIQWRNQYDRDPDYVVMGNVAYPCEIDHDLQRGYSLVAQVGIGEVNFTPSREALHMTPTTRNTLARIKRDFEDAIKDAVQKNVDGAKTGAEAVARLEEWRKIVPTSQLSGNYSWQGKVIPEVLDAPLNASHYPDTGLVVVPIGSYVLSRHENPARIFRGSWTGAIWFYGYDTSKKFTAPKRRRIDHWNAQNGFNPTRYILVNDKAHIPTNWVDPTLVFSWEEIKSLKMPSNTPVGRGSNRIAGSYDVFDSGTFKRGIPADTFPPKQPIYWHHGNRWETQDYVAFLESMEPGALVVCLPANRIEKFKRDFPKAEKIVDKLHVLAKGWEKTLSEDEREALVLWQRHCLPTAQRLDPRKVIDPRLKRMAKAAGVQLSQQQKMQCSQVIRLLGSDALQCLKNWKNPMVDYPLTTDYDIQRHPKHSYIYINAVYKANNP